MKMLNKASRRNILLVVAEDMGPQLGTYGCVDARTPHLDRFSQSGVRFETAWCDFPICSPGRAAMLTGLPSHENGTFGLSTHRFSTFPGVPSLPELLRQAGYRTGLIGKLHVLPEWRFQCDFRWTDSRRFGHHAVEGRDYRRMLRVAENFMDDASAPFFLMVALPDAHVPFLRQSFGEPNTPLEADDVGIVPGMDRIVSEWKRPYADYHNCIRRVDSAFGGLTAILERLGVKENTTVLFTADHGLQFPRGKMTLYEPGLSVPLLLGGAGVVTPGQTINTPACGVDLFSTILDAADVDAPNIARGKSLFEIVASGSEDRCVFAGVTACKASLYYPQRAVRNRRHKLIRTFLLNKENPAYLDMQRIAEEDIRPPMPPIASLTPTMRNAYETSRNPPEYELYDLQDDPLETVNRSGDPALADTEATLREALAQWMRRTDDFLLDADRKARFEMMIGDFLASPPRRADLNYYEWDYVKTMRPNTL